LENLDKLPPSIQKIAREKFNLWKNTPFHPSLKFNCVNVSGGIWSICINLDYRALGVKKNDEIVWFWIGNHREYEKMI